MHIVLVEWDDSASGNTWVKRTQVGHIDPVVSVGVVIREDKEEIELVPNLTGDLKLHEITIPRVAIKRMRVLRIE